MNPQVLMDTARTLVADDKGLLAMDESNPTCNKRLGNTFKWAHGSGRIHRHDGNSEGLIATKIMKIQINTDHNIKGREAMAEQTKATVESTLGHLADHITRVEVHLSDENGTKTGSHDKRCMMEARLESHQPIAATHEAETIDEAIDGAVEKLKRLLDHTLGRLSDR